MLRVEEPVFLSCPVPSVVRGSFLVKFFSRAQCRAREVCCKILFSLLEVRNGRGHSADVEDPQLRDSSPFTQIALESERCTQVFSFLVLDTALCTRLLSQHKRTKVR